MAEEIEVEEDEQLAIAVPNIDPDAPPLTDEQIKFGLYNHAEVIQRLVQLINDQHMSVLTLMYIVAAYMKQYPLDLDGLDKPKIEKVELPGQYL